MDSAILDKHAEDLGFEPFWVPEYAIIPLQTSFPYPASDDGIFQMNTAASSIPLSRWHAPQPSPRRSKVRALFRMLKSEFCIGMYFGQVELKPAGLCHDNPHGQHAEQVLARLVGQAAVVIQSQNVIGFRPPHGS